MQELFEQQGLSQTVANAEQMKHFKNVVRSLMEQAEGILGELQMTAEGRALRKRSRCSITASTTPAGYASMTRANREHVRQGTQMQRREP